MTTRDELNKLLPSLRKIWAAKITAPPSVVQEKDRRDKPAKGPIWISRCTIPPPPEADIQSLIFKAIDHLAPEKSSTLHDEPTNVAIFAEWLGARKDVDKLTPEPEISETAKFQALNKNVEPNTPLLLFFHGGNMTMGGPVTYRPMLQRLAELSGARCFTPAYRLSPKHIFPSALLDSLAAYLYLLAPPPGSPHQAIPASNIILVGESVGCSLMFAVTKVLLTARKLGITSLQYHGRSVQLELPAGITAFGPYCDFTASLPSERLNIEKDVFLKTIINPINDPPSEDRAVNWPSTPSRHDFYCYHSAMDHPLVNPIGITDWTGAPPMWFCAGGHERPLDSAKVVAQRAHESRVPVQFEVYEEMPHIWFALLPAIPSTRKCYNNWAGAVQSITRGIFESRAVSFDSWTFEETRLGLDKLVSFPLEHVAKFLKAEKLNRRPISVRPRTRL